MHGAPLRGVHRTAHSSQLGIAGDGLTVFIHCLSVRTGMSVASHTATSIATARMAATESGRNGGHASREYHWHLAITTCRCGQCGLS